MFRILFYIDICLSVAWMFYRRFTNTDMSETRLFVSFWYELVSIIVIMLVLFLAAIYNDSSVKQVKQ